MDLRHREGLDAPPGVPARCVELAARGRQALDITGLALEDDGGAVTAYEMQERRDALLPLARAGRRALVAACSPEGWPPGDGAAHALRSWTAAAAEHRDG